MNRPTLVAFIFVLLGAPSLPQAKEMIVSGCVEQGVEGGCLIIEADGMTYNVSSARPRPNPGMYGTVSGRVFDGPTTCMQGTPLSPATWQEDATMHCPKKAAR